METCALCSKNKPFWINYCEECLDRHALLAFRARMECEPDTLTD